MKQMLLPSKISQGLAKYSSSVLLSCKAAPFKFTAGVLLPPMSPRSSSKPLSLLSEGCVLRLPLCQHPRNGAFSSSPTLFEGERAICHIAYLHHLAPLISHKTEVISQRVRFMPPVFCSLFLSKVLGKCANEKGFYVLFRKLCELSR